MDILRRTVHPCGIQLRVLAACVRNEGRRGLTVPWTASDWLVEREQGARARTPVTHLQASVPVWGLCACGRCMWSLSSRRWGDVLVSAKWLKGKADYLCPFRRD